MGAVLARGRPGSQHRCLAGHTLPSGHASGDRTVCCRLLAGTGTAAQPALGAPSTSTRDQRRRQRAGLRLISPHVCHSDDPNPGSRPGLGALILDSPGI